jgi:hypothetical protein
MLSDCPFAKIVFSGRIWTQPLGLRACALSREARRAEIWLHKMEEAAVAELRLAPDVVSYSAVLKAVAQCVRLTVRGDGSTVWSDHELAPFWPEHALSNCSLRRPFDLGLATHCSWKGSPVDESAFPRC